MFQQLSLFGFLQYFLEQEGLYSTYLAIPNQQRTAPDWDQGGEGRKNGSLLVPRDYGERQTAKANSQPGLWSHVQNALGGKKKRKKMGLGPVRVANATRDKLFSSLHW